MNLESESILPVRFCYCTVRKSFCLISCARIPNSLAPPPSSSNDSPLDIQYIRLRNPACTNLDSPPPPDSSPGFGKTDCSHLLDCTRILRVLSSNERKDSENRMFGQASRVEDRMQNRGGACNPVTANEPLGSRVP